MCTMHYQRARKGAPMDAPALARHGAKSGGRVAPEYTAWQQMRDRCQNVHSKNYPYYGGRGISVCARWDGSFAEFLADVGARPSSRHTIDRIETNGNYEPGNVRWATRAEQSKNRRPFSMIGKSPLIQWIAANGIRDSISGWARRTGFPRQCIRARLRMGWSPERIVSEPPGTSPKCATKRRTA